MQIESLEHRQLLHSDISVSFTATTLPSALVVGAKAKPATASLSLTNSGEALDKKDKTPITVQVGLSDAQGNLTVLGTAKIPANKFATSKPVKSTVKLAVPSTVAEGSYTLVAVLDASAADADQNPNGDIDADKTVTVSKLNTELTIVAAVSSLAATAEPSAKGTMDVSVKNIGNADAKGKGVVEIIAIKDNVTTVLGKANASLNIKAGATAVLKKLKFNAPDAAGTYELRARFASTTVAGDTPFLNELSSATLTVSGGTSAGNSEHPFPGSNLANTIFFKDDTGGISSLIEGGQHSSTLNNLVGIWGYSTKTKQLTMSVTAEPQTQIQVKILGYRGSFANKTVMFGVDKAGASGSFKYNGAVIYFKVN